MLLIGIDLLKILFSSSGVFCSIAGFGSSSPGFDGWVIFGCLRSKRAMYFIFSIYRNFEFGLGRTSWQIGSYKADEMAFQYNGDGTLYGNYTLVLWIASELRSTAADLLLLLPTVALGGSLNGKRILSMQSTEAMLALIWAKVELGSYKSLRGYIGQSEGANSPDALRPCQ